MNLLNITNSMYVNVLWVYLSLIISTDVMINHEKGKSLEIKTFFRNSSSVFSRLFRTRTVSKQSSQECGLGRNFRHPRNLASCLKRHGFSSNASVTLVTNHSRLQSGELQVPSSLHYGPPVKGAEIRRHLHQFYLQSKKETHRPLASTTHLLFGARGIVRIISQLSLEIKRIGWCGYLLSNQLKNRSITAQQMTMKHKVKSQAI